MKQELVRMSSIDNIELPGILYSPNIDTKKMVIHVHGLAGNFYENRFLDTLAKTYTEKGIAFLTFNNRGREFITEFLKGDGYKVIGACYERFEDSILDIDGVVNWVKEKGYTEIILEGHSYGCSKVLYYYDNKKDESIKQIVLLAPCDTPGETIKFLSNEEYNKAKEESERLVNENKENELIDFSVMANGKISAVTFYYNFLPGGENDFIRYRTGEESAVLNNIDIPVLIIFGDEDECVLTEPIDVVKNYLTNNIKKCDINIIPGADHGYNGKYHKLSEIIKNSISI